MRTIGTLLLSLVATPLWAECPQAPDHTDRQSELYHALNEASGEGAAQPYVNELWQLWTDAPDGKAQDLLDFGMGRIRVADLEAAIETFDELTEYCPDYAEGYNQRAFAFYLKQDFPRALDDLDRALFLSPDHVAALSGRVLTLMGLGRTEVAQSDLKRALGLNPWLPERHLLVQPAGEDI